MLLHWLTIAAVFSAMMALSRLLQTDWPRENRALAAVLFGLALTFGHFAMLWSGGYVRAPWLLGVAAPFIAAVGPMLHVFARTAMQLQPANLWRWYLPPMLLAAVGYLPLYVQPNAVKLQLMQGQKLGDARWLNEYLGWFDLLLIGIVLAYLVAMTRLLLQANAEQPRERRARGIALALAFVLVASVAVLFAGQASASQDLRSLGMLGLSCYPFALFLIQARYPDMLPLIRSSVQRTRYAQRRVASDSVERLSGDLERAVTERYADEDLSLPTLAEGLAMSPHELSELLNLHIGVSFNRYVNRIRVQQAQALLVAKPSMPVLDVGFAVGFGSKSVFNECFKQETGSTPSTYRREQRMSRDAGSPPAD